MDKDRDLLPWIFGGLSMATVAIAITVGSTHGIVPQNLHAPSRTTAPSQTTAHILPELEVTPAPAPALGTAQIQTVAPTLAAAQIQTVTPTMAPSSRIWECTINGQRTFSDHPCGDKSSVREIGPTNRMDPTPILPYARSYVPESSYPPEYSYQGGQEDSIPGEQQFANDSYPVFIGIPVHEHRRLEHGHRPHGQHRGPPPRRN